MQESRLPLHRLPGAQLPSKKTRAAGQNAGRRVGNHVAECLMRGGELEEVGRRAEQGEGGETEGGTSRGEVMQEDAARKNRLCRVHNVSQTHSGAGSKYTNRQTEKKKNQVLTHISAFVVMAFPAYRLIISGARYERVVYLQVKSGQSAAGQRV